jgi:inward rectifier potassium channel
VAVVAPYRGITAFQFRIVNQRRNQIVELEAKVVLSRFATTGGTAVRRFDDLALERRRVTFFPLAWTVVHPIDETSPLHGTTPEQLSAWDAEFLVLLTGTDDTFSQTVHARSSYHAAEVVWGARFRDMFNPPTPDGVLSIDIRRLDEVQLAAEAAPAAAAAS